MSEEDQNTIIGRTVTEYAEAKKQLAALFTEADRHAKELNRIQSYLNDNPREYGHADLRHGSPAPDLTNYPMRETVNSLISETLELMKKKRSLSDKLRTYGVEPKD